MKKTRNDLWNEKYKIAKKYYEAKGNLKVPRRYIIDGVKLGDWISKQRDFKKKNKLSKEREEKLNNIGMVWQIYDKSKNNNDFSFYLKERKQWDENYKIAKEYFKNHKNLIIPDNLKIAKWLKKQRFLYNNNKLTVNRTLKLDSIGMYWDINLIYNILNLENSINDFKEKRILMLNNIANNYAVIGITNILIYYKKDNLCNIKKEAEILNEELKDDMDNMSYNILITYFLGIKTEILASIYNISKQIIDTTLLKSLKNFLLVFDSHEKENVLVKK